jgi:hypothetical protein
MPEYRTVTATGNHGNYVHGNDIVNIPTYAGEAIHLLDWSAVSVYSIPGSGNAPTEYAVPSITIDTTCWDNGSVWGEWSETLNQPTYNVGNPMDQWLAGAGLACNHLFSLTGLNHPDATYDTDWMSAVYQIVPVVVHDQQRLPLAWTQGSTSA